MKNGIIFLLLFSCLNRNNAWSADGDGVILKLNNKESQNIISATLENNGFKEKLLKDVANDACKCIDSIVVINKSQKQITTEISKCIDSKVITYQASLAIYENLKNANKSNQISINTNKNSKEYIRYYREIEARLMDSCKAIKRKVASENKESKYSGTNNAEALEQYNLGAQLSDKGIYDEAISYYIKATRLDPEFAFAWDNLGICYRKTNNPEKAIEAYRESLKINPYGEVPLQNIAVAYEAQKEYDKAIDAYKEYIKNYPDGVEGYYGVARILFFYKNEDEQALEDMCIAYNLYAKMNSPYRIDAEKIISQIYASMKQHNKEKKFNEILTKYNIKPK